MLLHSFALLLALTGTAPAEKAPADAGQNPPMRALRVSAVEGTVHWHTPADPSPHAARVNDVLAEGDIIDTGDNARADVDLGLVAVRVAPKSHVVFATLGDTRFTVQLGAGSVAVSAVRAPQGQSIAVNVEDATLNIIAIGEYRLSLDPNTHRAGIMVREGAATLSLAASSRVLGNNESVQLSRTDAPAVADASSRDAFDAWCDERREASAIHKAPQYVSRDVVGWQDLDGHGTWTDTEDGPAFRPTDVAADWAPYTQGQWEWSDVYGWTWVDDAAWNYAPSHYGRWGYYDDAWMWLPGPAATSAVYSPALVAFLNVNAFADGLIATWAYASWFPLGPREPYLPGYHTTDWYIEHMNQGIPLTIVPGINRGAPHAVVAVRDKVMQAGAKVAPARQPLSVQARQYAPAVGGFSAVAPREAPMPRRGAAAAAAASNTPPPAWAAARRSALVQTFRAQSAQPLYRLPMQGAEPRGRGYAAEHRVPRPSVGGFYPADVETPDAGGQRLGGAIDPRLPVGFGVGGFVPRQGAQEPRPVGPGPQQTQHAPQVMPAAPHVQPRGPMPVAPHAFSGHR